MCGAPRSGQRAGVHAPQAEFTFRTYCRNPEVVRFISCAESRVAILGLLFPVPFLSTSGLLVMRERIQNNQM